MISVNVETRQPEKHHIYVAGAGDACADRDALHSERASRRACARNSALVADDSRGLDALSESEDITFVEVKEPGQNVRVAKSGGSIVVDVNENDETVHVSTPIRAMSSAIEELAAASPAPTR